MIPSRAVAFRASILAVAVALLASGPASGQTMRTVMQLTEVDSRASAAGDVNGDGYPDLIAGAKLYWGGPGADGIPDRVLETTGDSITSSAGAGDVNGDGYADLIIGHRDLARLFWGGPDADGITDLMLMSVTPGDWFGYSVSGAGDVNADGYADVIVGAAAASRAYVYWGGPEPDADPDQVYRREPGDSFGHAVAGAGDVNGDGYDDVIVGSPGRQGSPYSWAYVFCCGPGQDEWPEMNLHGEPPHPWGPSFDDFGRAVSGTGDVNGDGYDDVIVGAAWGDFPRFSGLAHVYRGGQFPDSHPDLILRGESEWSGFGYSVSGAGDVNGDGYDDFLVGADYPGDLRRAHLFLGGPTVDTTPVVRFGGSAIADAGDVDGDGRDDFIVGNRVYSLFRVEGPPLFVTQTTLEEAGRSDARASLGRAGTSPRPTATLTAWPIPYRSGDLTVTVSAAERLARGAESLELAVYDVAGRRVRTLARDLPVAGSHHVSWNGRDARGQAVSGGIYFLQLGTGRNRTVLKVPVLR